MYRTSRRTKNLFKGASSTAVARIASSVFGLISMGIIGRVCSAEELGLWALLMSLPGFFSGIDLGFSSALKNKLSTLYAKQNEKEACAYFFSVFYGFAFLVTILLIVFAFAGHYIPWPQLRHIEQDKLTKIGRFLFTFNVFTILASVPFGLAYYAGFYSYQESHINAACTLVTSFTISVILALSYWLHASFRFIAIIYFLATGFLIYAVSFFLFLQRRHWEFIILQPRIVVRKIRGLLSNSIKFVGLQIASGVFNSVDAFIVANLLGLQMTGDYYLVKRICSVAVGLHLVTIGATWPAYTEAAESNDFRWIKKTIRYVLLLTAVGFLLFGICLYLCGIEFIYLWTGKSVKTLSLTILFGLWSLLTVLSNCLSLVLNAVSKVMIQMLLGLSFAFLVIPLSTFLGRKYGVGGVVLAQIILVSLGLISNAYQVGYYLRKHGKQAE